MVQETSFGNDRDQKTKLTATATKGTRGNVSDKVRRQSISQERGRRGTINAYYYVKEANTSRLRTV